MKRIVEQHLARLRRAQRAPEELEALAELRRSGLWEMMERCYPSSQAQSQ